MSDFRSLLTNCFAVIFPELPRAAISSAAMTSVPEWDSLRSINLLSVIEEEFGIQIPPEDLAQFVSFESIETYLQSRQAEVTAT